MTLAEIRARVLAARNAALALLGAAGHVPSDHGHYARGLAREIRRRTGELLARVEPDDGSDRLDEDEGDLAVIESAFVEIESIAREARRETRRLERVARVRARRRRAGRTA